jgi:hypothetical protein
MQTNERDAIRRYGGYSCYPPVIVCENDICLLLQQSPIAAVPRLLIVENESWISVPTVCSCPINGKVLVKTAVVAFNIQIVLVYVPYK